MSDQAGTSENIDAGTQSGVPSSSGPNDTAPIPTPGDQGASAPSAQDVKADPSTAPADRAAKEPTSDDGGEPKKQGGGFQKRIAELTRRASDAERDRERLLGLLERTAPQPAAGGKQPEAADDQPPQQNDPKFKTYEEYLDARADWRADQRVKVALKDQGQQTQQRQQQESHEATVAEFKTTVVKEGKDIEGFEEAYRVLTTHPDDGGPEVHPLMADFLASEAENKALMVKFLGENPDKATELSRLHPRTMINRLAKLDAQLGAKPPTKVSNAPAPPPVLAGSSAPHVDLAKTDIDTYADHWHARRNKKR